MSFSDMMSSARGPGLIGTLLALVVLVGFGFLFMIASDEGPLGESQAIGAVIARQGKLIENLRGNIAVSGRLLEGLPSKVANTKELARLHREKISVQAKIGGLNSRVVCCRVDITRDDAAFEAYRNEYRAVARGKAKGEIFDKLETRGGAVYQNVNFREVTAIGIQIRHDGGLKRILFEELSEALQDRFQYDPKEKQTAMVEEAENLLRHDTETTAAEAVEDEQKEAFRQKDAALVKKRLRQDLVTKEAQIVAVGAELAQLAAELSSEGANANAARAAGRIYLNQSNRINGSIRGEKNRLSDLQAEVRKIKDKLAK